MTITLVIVAAIYFAGASLIALSSTLEAERSPLTATDAAVIALVSMAWPAVGCAMLLMLTYRQLFPKRCAPLSAMSSADER